MAGVNPLKIVYLICLILSLLFSPKEIVQSEQAPLLCICAFNTNYVHGLCSSIYCWTSINNYLPARKEKEKEKENEKKEEFSNGFRRMEKKKIVEGKCACSGEISESITSKVRENLLVDLNK